MKVQFGHGGHLLDGWLNLEQHEADITKPLAFKNDSVDFVMMSHVLEHVTPQQGYKFLLEAYRILKPSGVVRIIVPDIQKTWRLCDNRYLDLLKEGIKTWWPAANWKTPIDNPTDRDAVETLIFCHGHQALYTKDLLVMLMFCAGFTAKVCEYGKSLHPELNDVDRHHLYMGLENCILESVIIEGTK